MAKRHSLLRAIGLVTAAVSLFVLPLVVDTIAPSKVNGQSHAHTAGTEILYTLNWRWGKAIPQADHGGWTVTNKLGYRIRVRRGYLVTGGVQLVHCQANAKDQALSQFMRWLYPEPVYAGHGGEQDESRSAGPYVESLAQPDPITLERVLIPQGATYCQVHYLVAPGLETAKGAPAEINMAGTSLYIEGDYYSSGQETAQPFTIKTELAWGAISNMLPVAGERAVTRLQISNKRAIISFRRDLGTLFDEVDFDHMSETDQARAVLRSLTRQTQVFVESE